MAYIREYTLPPASSQIRQRHYRIIHNASCLPPKFLLPLFKFLLSNADVLRKIEKKKNNSFAKFGRGGRGANKVSYEKFERGEYGQIWLRSRLSIIAIINLICFQVAGSLQESLWLILF